MTSTENAPEPPPNKLSDQELQDAIDTQYGPAAESAGNAFIARASRDAVEQLGWYPALAEMLALAAVPQFLTLAFADTDLEEAYALAMRFGHMFIVNQLFENSLADGQDRSAAFGALMETLRQCEARRGNDATVLPAAWIANAAEKVEAAFVAGEDTAAQIEAGLRSLRHQARAAELDRALGYA